MDVEALFGARGDRLRFEAPRIRAAPGPQRPRLAGWQVVGWIGELHPRWAQQADLAHAPVVFELDVAALSEGELPQVREQSRQPIVVRDLALWVDAQVPVSPCWTPSPRWPRPIPGWPCCADLRLFDVWRESPRMACPRPRKLAFRFWLQDTEVTLDDGWRTAWRASGMP